MAMETSTFGEKCKKLNGLIEKYAESIGKEYNEDRGARVHPYGALNVYCEKQEAFQLLSGMKAKCEQIKGWGTGIQGVTKAVLERKQQVDVAIPLTDCITSCIEKLRDATQDLNLKAVVRKLQAITEEVGLRFDNTAHPGTDCFISSNMFYVEVQLDTSGGIIDVKVQAHSGDAKRCKELVDILKKRNYKEFKAHLEGLANLYKFNEDTFVKTNIFNALEAVEKDILTVSSLEGSSPDPCEKIMTGSVGYVLKRQAGHLMQLTYFANLVDLLDVSNAGKKKQFTDDNPVPRNLGYSACISVESSEPCHLPTSSLATADISNRIQYLNMDRDNSKELPATFIMKLTKPLPIAANLLKEIHSVVTGDVAFTHSSEVSLDNLIIKQHLDLQNRSQWANEEFHTLLPDQHHIFRPVPSEGGSNIGLIVSRVPFRHPSHAPSIIQVLRRQAMYNTLFTSCTGKSRKLTGNCSFAMKSKLSDGIKEKQVTGKGQKKYYFDVTTTGPETITVSFQHPLHFSLASVDFTIAADCSIQSTLNVAPSAAVFCSSSYIDKVIQKCVSIPVVMRSIIRKASSYVPKPAAEPLPLKAEPEAKHSKLRLQIPSLSVDSFGPVPLVSPGLYPLSAVAGLSGASASPMISTAFQFPLTPEVTGTLPGGSLPGGYTKPLAGKRKTKGSPIKVGTPDAKSRSRPQAIPKITLKRKKGSEYEIDKEKSNVDDLVTSEIHGQDAEKDADATDSVYLQFGSSATGGQLPLGEENVEQKLNTQTTNLTFGGGSLPFDLSVDTLSAGGISISSVSELESLLGPGIDVTGLMSGNLSSQMAMSGGTFPEGLGSNVSVGAGGSENQMEAFDLDAITAGGSQVEFNLDDALGGGSAGAIDPSIVVGSSSALASAAADFDVDTSLIDIDSFMMVGTPEQHVGLGDVDAATGSAKNYEETIVRQMKS